MEYGFDRYNIITKPINFYALILLLIPTISCNFFYLFDFSNFVFGTDDIILVIVILLFLYVFIRNIYFCLHNIPKIFILIELFSILLVIVSSYAANKSWNQPLMYGIRAQRNIIVYPFLFLTYYWLIKLKRISFKDIIVVFYIFSMIILILGFLQIILGPNHMFLKISEEAEIGRYSSLRLRFPTGILYFCLFNSLNKILRKNRIKLHSLFFILSFLFSIFIGQSRMVVICLCFGILAIFLFSKDKNDLKKAILLLTFLISILMFLLFTSMGKDIISQIEGTSENDTSLIREIGREYYWNTFMKNPLLSGGYVNIQWEKSAIESMYTKYVYANDNGIFGYIFYYGLLGIIYILLIYIFMFKNSFYINKVTADASLIGYLVYSIIGIYSLYSLGMGSGYFFYIFLIIIEAKKFEIEGIKLDRISNVELQ